MAVHTLSIAVHLHHTSILVMQKYFPVKYVPHVAIPLFICSEWIELKFIL